MVLSNITDVTMSLQVAGVRSQLVPGICSVFLDLQHASNPSRITWELQPSSQVRAGSHPRLFLSPSRSHIKHMILKNDFNIFRLMFVAVVLTPRVAHEINLLKLKIFT